VIVDSSAVLAILLEEPDQERFVDAIVGARPCRISVSN